MTQYSDELELAEGIATEAGDIILRYFDDGQQNEVKADGSPVTIADTSINRLVIERIQERFPDDGIIGEEESTADYGQGRRWLCDPIDGTLGYTWGTPTAMFSLALVVDGKPVMGVAYDAFLRRLYRGIAGEASSCNDTILKVSDKLMGDGVVAVTSSVKKIFHQDPFVASLVESGVSLASFSGAVYKACLVARGKFVGYAEHVVNPHDMAAVQLIVEGAGGKVTALDGSLLNYGRPFKGAVVSNGKVHDELVAHVAKSLP